MLKYGNNNEKKKKKTSEFFFNYHFTMKLKFIYFFKKSLKTNKQKMIFDPLVLNNTEYKYIKLILFFFLHF